MAPTTIKAALAEMLEDLTNDNFQRFCEQLLDRREKPQVRRCRLEGKSRREVANVLVSTFTEAGSVEVTLRVLRLIGCGEEAERLAEYKPEAGEPKPEPGASNSQHFVDRHKVQLIRRVSNIAAVLDELLDAKVIQQEQYDKIRALPTPQEKLRELYSGPLEAAAACKEVFYRSLERNEPYLIKELEKND